MPGRSLALKWIVPVGLALMLCATSAWAQPGEDPRTAPRFLKELRDQGLDDMALDYIKVLKADTGLPAEFKDILDYEEGAHPDR